MPTILVIDQESSSRHMLCQLLEEAGYTTYAASSGDAGLALAQAQSPDLVVLELDLPGLDGFAVCRILRFRSDVPILIVSRRGALADRVRGLDMGADDYLCTPWEPPELLARLRALLRRAERPLQLLPPTTLVAGTLRLDVSRRRCFVAERELTLSQKEFDLLACLMRNAGLALSREQLLHEVWGAETSSTSRTVDVHVRWLRTKIEPDTARPRYIETVHGHGYRFGVPVTQLAGGRPPALLDAPAA
ncbi:MAG: response regulator transcription factor [Roseiflexaceae bacterium]